MMHWRPEPQVLAIPQQLPYLEPEQVWPAVAPHLPADDVGRTVELDVEVLVEVLLVLVEVEVVLGLPVVEVVLVLVDVTVLKTVEVTPPVGVSSCLKSSIDEGVGIATSVGGAGRTTHRAGAVAGLAPSSAVNGGRAAMNY
jgi:hypothetical protein